MEDTPRISLILLLFCSIVISLVSGYEQMNVRTPVDSVNELTTWQIPNRHHVDSISLWKAMQSKGIP